MNDWLHAYGRFLEWLGTPDGLPWLIGISFVVSILGLLAVLFGPRTTSPSKERPSTVLRTTVTVEVEQRRRRS